MRNQITTDLGDEGETGARKRGGRFAGPFSKTTAGRDRRAERRRVRSVKSGI